MFEIDPNRLATMRTHAFANNSDDRHGRLWKTAARLHAQALSAGRVARFRAWLTGRSNALYNLNRLSIPASAQHYCGVQTVPVKLIQGTEGRCRDFDRDFHPLHARGRERWLRVVLAVLDGQSMTPISLIRVGDIFFVRDGHHRVSIARAWGQDYVDAEVTMWEAPHPLPWEAAAPAEGRASLGARSVPDGVPNGIRHLIPQIR